MGVLPGTARARAPPSRALLASGGSRRTVDEGDNPSATCSSSGGGAIKAAGYQSMGSFHSDNIDALRALPAADYKPPPLPRGLLPIAWRPTHASTYHATAAAPYANNDDAARMLDDAIAHAAACPLGRELKAAHFLLDPEWTFVNHGEVG